MMTDEECKWAFGIGKYGVMQALENEEVRDTLRAELEAEWRENGNVRELARAYLAALFSGTDWETAEHDGYAAGAKERASAIVEMLENAAHGNAAPRLADTLEVVLETVTDASLPNFPTVADIGGDATAGGARTSIAELEKMLSLAEYWRKDAEQDWKEARERCIEAERDFLEIKDELEALRARAQEGEVQNALNIENANIATELANLPAPERAKAENEQSRIVEGQYTENEPLVNRDKPQPAVRGAVKYGYIGGVSQGEFAAWLIDREDIPPKGSVARPRYEAARARVKRWEREGGKRVCIGGREVEYTAAYRASREMARAFAREIVKADIATGKGKRVSIEAAEREGARDFLTAHAAGIRAVGA